MFTNVSVLASYIGSYSPVYLSSSLMSLSNFPSLFRIQAGLYSSTGPSQNFPIPRHGHDGTSSLLVYITKDQEYCLAIVIFPFFKLSLYHFSHAVLDMALLLKLEMSASGHWCPYPCPFSQRNTVN